MKLSGGRLVLGGDAKDEAAIADRQVELVWPRWHLAPLAGGQCEAVGLKKIEHRHTTFLLDLGGRGRETGIVKLDMDDF